MQRDTLRTGIPPGVAPARVLWWARRGDVNTNLAAEKIVGSDDMTPAAIRAEAQEAGLDVDDITPPSESVAGEAIDTGSEARTCGEYMRIHTLEATGGRTYSEMGRFLTADGEETNDSAAAATTASGQPQPNAARDIWVTYTAPTTAPNMAFFGNQVSLLTIVIGVALIIAGVGFGVLASAAFRWIPRTEARSAPGVL